MHGCEFATGASDCHLPVDAPLASLDADGAPRLGLKMLGQRFQPAWGARQLKLRAARFSALAFSGVQPSPRRSSPAPQARAACFRHGCALWRLPSSRAPSLEQGRRPAEMNRKLERCCHGQAAVTGRVAILQPGCGREAGPLGYG